MLPGLRLRRVREHLGLTYRDVERCSYEIAAKRGRPEFILHISRLADMENRNVVPGLHKLYALAVVYHLNPAEIFRWYEVPVDEFFADGAMFPAPQTHLGSPPASLRVPLRFDPAFDPDWTSEYDRPLYFVEVREGYRCGWFHQDGSRLVMQPHPLSRCLPEWWQTPDQAEIVGRVTGVVTRLNEPWNNWAEAFPAAHAGSNRKVP